MSAQVGAFFCFLNGQRLDRCVQNKKSNDRAQSVHKHLQHFQSSRSYRTHALSSVAKSSPTQLHMPPTGKARARNCALRLASAKKQSKPRYVSAGIVVWSFMSQSASSSAKHQKMCCACLFSILSQLSPWCRSTVENQKAPAPHSRKPTFNRCSEETGVDFITLTCSPAMASHAHAP